MIKIQIPNNKIYEIEHIVFDYNGTLALEGIVSPSVKDLLAKLVQQVHVSVITADTFGLARGQLCDLPEIELIILPGTQDSLDKAAYVQKLGLKNTVVVGNGMNDRLMFSVSELAICILGPEGASLEALNYADVIVKSPEEAILLFLNPKRLIATLRK